MKTLRTMTAMILALALAGAALAAEPAAEKSAAKAKEPNMQADAKKSGQAETNSPARQLQMGLELAKYARQNQSPAAMLAAVQMLKQVSTGPLKAEKTSRKDKDGAAKAAAPTEAAKKATEPTLEADKLLAEAKGWAETAQDKPMLAAIDAEAQRKPRTMATLGASGGPKIAHGQVMAYDTDVYQVVFRGEELAAVAVSGDGDTDLDLYIYDENGNLVAKDDDITDECRCAWVPAFRGPFTIRIKNRGGVYNSYVLQTN
jgi:flagellar motor protein MotB